jgi:hypothetical protein
MAATREAGFDPHQISIEELHARNRPGTRPFLSARRELTKIAFAWGRGS